MMATAKMDDFVYRSTPLVLVLIQLSENHSGRGVTQERETEMQKRQTLSLSIQLII